METPALITGCLYIEVVAVTGLNIASFDLYIIVEASVAAEQIEDLKAELEVSEREKKCESMVLYS